MNQFHFYFSCQPKTYPIYVTTLFHALVEFLGVLLKSLIYESVFVSSGADSCIAKIKMEYETLGDKDLSEEELRPIRDGSIGVLKAVEGYLLANPDVYA